VLVGSLVAAAGALAAHRGHVFAFDANLFRLVNQLPDVLGRPLLVVMQLGVVGAVAVVAAVALAARRPRLARDLILAGGLAWVLAKVVKGVVGEARPVALLDGVVERAVDTGLGYPSGHVAVAAAAVHLVLGVPGGRPAASAIVEGLLAAGIEPVVVQPMGADARGSVPFVVRARDGQRWFVKAVGREQRDADLLYKLWRWAAYREVEDETPFATPKQKVEHEAYVGLLAARARVRTPAVETAAPAGDGHVLLVEQHVGGQTLDRLDAARVDDRLLAAVWVQVERLHGAGIAHRDLRRANVLVDLDGRPWLLDFGFAEAAASPRTLTGAGGGGHQDRAAPAGTAHPRAPKHPAAGGGRRVRRVPAAAPDRRARPDPWAPSRRPAGAGW
jgi:Protein kinase domain